MTKLDKKIILDYLGDNQPFSYMNTTRNSTIVAGLRECRGWTGRDQFTGELKESPHCGYPCHWLSAIGYFAILDQIGSCYIEKTKARPQSSYNKINFAIQNFGFDLIQNDLHKLHALIALRNAFTHDFNLLNKPERANRVSLEQHKFTVHCDLSKNSDIVKLPSKPWDGDISNKDFYNPNDSTFVNLYQFGNLVEEIFRRLKEKVKLGEVELLIDCHELINKYTFVISDSVI